MDMSCIGRRVRIVQDCSDRKVAGQVGTIVGLRRIQTTDSPIIQLDSGTEIGGWECWWDWIDQIPADKVRTFVRVDLKKLQRVAVVCRCGHRSVVELPAEIGTGQVIHPCPKCNMIFTVERREGGNCGGFQVIRHETTMAESSFAEVKGAFEK